jgi:hypothetical protein
MLSHQCSFTLWPRTASSITDCLHSSNCLALSPRSSPHKSIQVHMSLSMESQRKNGQTWCAVSVSSTNPFARLPLSMVSPMRQSGAFFVVMARKEQDKPRSFHTALFEDACMRWDDSYWNSLRHRFLSPSRSESPSSSSAKSAPSLASSSCTVSLAETCQRCWAIGTGRVKQRRAEGTRVASGQGTGKGGKQGSSWVCFGSLLAIQAEVL